MKGVDQGRYEADLKECQIYAEHHLLETRQWVQASGRALVLSLGLSSVHLLARLAEERVWGLPSAEHKGRLPEGLKGAQGQVNIIRNCMAGRGNRVLR